MTLFADLGRLVRSRRATRAVLAVVLAMLTFVALFSSVMPVGAESPAASIAATPAPIVTPATSVSPDESATPAATETPASSAAPCPLPPITPAPTPTAGASPAGTPDLNATPTPAPTPAPARPLCPAQLSGSPTDLLAFLFNPIFQTLFLGLALFYRLTGDIGIAIIILTLIIKTILIPLFRAQIVSQRRLQMIQPEIRALGTKYKGNRTKINEETMRLYKERGVNPTSGCLPSLLQLFLLIPIYSVISTGLASPDITSALQVFGFHVLQPFACQATGPCIDPTIHWLFNMDAHVPQVLFHVFGFGVSGLALISAGLQLVQTRMAQPRTRDAQQASQQRIFLLLPLFSIVYGSFLPGGLFIYWIVFTLFSVVQQYLIAGWGSLFPLFGWTPGFARDHQPRFPVSPPKLTPPPSSASGADARRAEDDNRTATDRAAGTIKPARQRGRTSRRGRRR